MDNPIPCLGNTVNEILDAFRQLDRDLGQNGWVEARDIGGLRYRWQSAISGGGLGVSGHDGLTLRAATDTEYTALERAVGAGQAQITHFNRITRKTNVLHQSNGRTVPMD